MQTIFNFNMDKIRELNLRGLQDYKEKAANRKPNEKIVKLVLDTDDILILKFIVGIGNSTSTIKDKKDKAFFWVNYSALLNEYNGLLFLSKSALQVRLGKYVAMGLVERKCVKNEDGSFSFFKLTGITDLLSDKITLNEKSKSKKTVEEELQEKMNISSTQAKEIVSYAKEQEAKSIYHYCKAAIANGYFTKKKTRSYVSTNNRFNNFPQREYSREDFQRMEMLLFQKQSDNDEYDFKSIERQLGIG